MGNLHCEVTPAKPDLSEMKVCRFESPSGKTRVGLLLPENILLDLSASNVCTIFDLLEWENLPERLADLQGRDLPRHSLNEVRLLPPVERQEVWAVGVTYLRSKAARMEESDFSATAYDKVYDAARPELFFKAMPEKVVGHSGEIGIRRDANGMCRRRNWRWCSIPAARLPVIRLAMI